MTEQITWIGTKDAAAQLGITIRSLYRAVDEGRLPAYKLGRVIRLKQNEIDAFIEASRIEAGSIPHLYPDAKKKD
jgi:excisionase family DNA binding protein